MSLTVLVAGATGRFRPIVPMLVQRGHRVRAGTRDPGSAAALELAALGAEPTVCDFDDLSTIEDAARGADAVFATGTAHRVGPDGEVRHGNNLVEAMNAAVIGHVVYTSGAGADRHTGVGVFERKWQVEERLTDRRLPTTILAPVFLMENVFNPWNLPALAAGVFPSPTSPTRAIQQIPIPDIATFAVYALEHRGDLVGQRIELASDSLDAIEEARVISSVSGRRLEVREATPAGALRGLFEWLERVGFSVDIAALRRDFPTVPWHSFSDWAVEQDWTTLDPPVHVGDPTGCSTRQ